MGNKSITALLIALPVWLCVSPCPDLAPSPPRAAAAELQIHDTSLDEALDFYQFSDDDGGLHFVDSPEKIPVHLRGKAIVRKDIPSARQSTRVAIVDNAIHVPVLFKNGTRTEKAILVLDTGAGITCITEELAARLGIDLSTTRKSTLRLADGSVIDVRLAKVDSVAIGFRMKAPLEIAIIHYVGTREIHDGLLGFDFLGDFQYQIDVPGGMIRWQ